MATKKMQKGGKVTKALPKAQKGVSYKAYLNKKAAEPKFTPPNNKPTQDSTQYYADKAAYYSKAGDNLFETQKQKDNTFSKDGNKAYNIATKAQKDKERQAKKGKPGFDNNGFPAKYKTGGMVNSNAKLTASKKATGKVGGVTKAVSKAAVKTTSPKGRVGGTSTAPKTATPKMKMGGMKKKSC